MRDALDPENSRERLHANTARVATPSPLPHQRGVSQAAARRSVAFTPSLSVHRYPPAVWNEDEEDEDDETEWDLEGYEDEDPDLADEQAQMESQIQQMEPDDGMSWEDGAMEEIQRQALAVSSTQKQIRFADIQGQHPSQSPVQQILHPSQQSTNETSPTLSTSPKPSDPALVTDTRKVTVTPSIARDPALVGDEPPQRPQPAQPVTLLPSAIMAQQEAERKRTREEIEALEAAQKKARGKITPDQHRPQPTGKLRKERNEPEEETKEKKRSGIFGIFARKKDKSSKSSITSSTTSLDSTSDLRISDDSSVSPSQQQDGNSPVTASARQQQQQQIQQQAGFRNGGADPKRTHTSPTGSQDHISQHASQLREYDLQQQKLFHEYLTRSPSSPPEASYGLASAPLMPYSQSFSSSSSSTNNLSPAASRPRPGSLILAPSTTDGQGVPDLSVVRIFAGKHVQTEATFKTVLLNSSTTSSDLVKQALQRFRLPAGEDASQYYLSMKQVEGSFAILRSEERPLGVFESLVEAAMELPRVKRSSVGSISSVNSDLSMHPAIKKLAMNDFTDDSAVKFYLNRRPREGETESPDGGEEDVTLIADSTITEEPRSQYLSATPQSPAQERFSSPGHRFSMQVLIYPDDLPEDMVFDTQTEAIVFKNTVKERPQSDVSTSSGVSLSYRRKIFTFHKNITVAEVIEIGLERFGIVEGVVDGGDEVEDKSLKRRSSFRVRYALHVEIGGKGKPFSPFLVPHNLKFNTCLKPANSPLQARLSILILVPRRSSRPTPDRSVAPPTRQCCWETRKTSRPTILPSSYDARLHTVIQRLETVCPHPWTKSPFRSSIENRCQVLLRMPQSPEKTQNDNSRSGLRRRSLRLKEKPAAPPSVPFCRRSPMLLTVSTFFYPATLSFEVPATRSMRGRGTHTLTPMERSTTLARLSRRS